MRRLALGAVVLACCAGQVWADSIVSIYSDKGAFLADTGATSATGPLPHLGAIPGGANGVQTVGDVTFTMSAPASQLWFGREYDLTAHIPGPDIGTSDVENINADLASPVLALGFDFVEPEFDPHINAPFVDSTFTVSLLLEAEVLDSFTFNAPNDTAAFVGVTSSAPFDRVEIRETVGGIENEWFGQFYTAPVPEPSTLFLLAMGVVGLLAYGWRRRKA